MNPDQPSEPVTLSAIGAPESLAQGPGIQEPITASLEPQTLQEPALIVPESNPNPPISASIPPQEESESNPSPSEENYAEESMKSGEYEEEPSYSLDDNPLEEDQTLLQSSSKDFSEEQSPTNSRRSTRTTRNQDKRRLVGTRNPSRNAKKPKIDTHQHPQQQEEPVDQSEAYTKVEESSEEIKERTELLHRQWRFLTIVHFLEHFRESLEVPSDLTPPDLEMPFVTKNYSPLFVKLVVFLLSLVRVSVKPSESNWYRVLNIVLNRRSHFFEDGNPLEEIEEEEFFNKVTMEQKILITQYLCDWALEENNSLLQEIKDNKQNPLFLRPLPLGYDKEENSFWRFGSSDLMYKEIKFDDEERRWELVCSDVEGWKALAETFEESDDQDEKDFRSFMIDELLPPMIEKAEKEAKRLRRLGRYNINRQNILSYVDRPRRSTRSNRSIFNYEDYMLE